MSAKRVRFNFRCWKVDCIGHRKPYSLTRRVNQERLIVTCPYCGAEGVVELANYRREQNIVAASGDSEVTLEDFVLPEVLPTNPLPNNEDASE